MNNLHIGDCAGISSLVEEKGIIILRGPNNYTRIYPNYKIINFRVRYYLIYLFGYILIKRPRNIWFHSALLEFRILSKFKPIFRSKFIYWSHGSDLRNKPIPGFLDKADTLFKSTNSISDTRFIIKNRPIDKNLFFPDKKDYQKGLHISYNSKSTQKVISLCNQLGIELTIIDSRNPLGCKEFASLLRESKFYFEFKGLYPERSKTFLEAQACNCFIIEESNSSIQKKLLIKEV